MMITIVCIKCGERNLIEDYLLRLISQPVVCSKCNETTITPQFLPETPIEQVEESSEI